MGRPDEISLAFDRRIRSDTETAFLTKIVTRGVNSTVNFFYHHSRIKEYLKDGRALRVETVVNNPGDLGVLARLPHLPELVTKARDANDRLLHAQRVGQRCVFASQPSSGSRFPRPPSTGGGLRPWVRGPSGHVPWSARSPRVYAVTGFTKP
jgi:hypothetical protein